MGLGDPSCSSLGRKPGAWSKAMASRVAAHTCSQPREAQECSQHGAGRDARHGEAAEVTPNSVCFVQISPDLSCKRQCLSHLIEAGWGVAQGRGQLLAPH